MTEPPPPPVEVRRRRHWGLRLAQLLLVIILLAAAWHFLLEPRLFPTQNQRTDTAARPPGGGGGAGGSRFSLNAPQPVGIAAATKGDIDITLNALGTVTPLATVTVQTQISGQLVQIGFTEGQMVKKGDFLAQIDPRPYQVALDQAQGQLARDQALLKGAQVDLARYQKLAAQNSIAQQQADDQLYLVHQDEGTVKLDQAQVDNAKLNLAYCRIVSPVTGKVGLRLVDEGNYVQAGSATGLVVITQLQPITVVFPVAEDYLPQILKRTNGGAKLPVTAFDRGQTTKLATGTLAAIDSQIDPTTGTVKFKAQFDNDDGALFPQQFVNAQLLIDTMHDVVTAPIAGIQRGAPGTFVYLTKDEKTVSVVPVKLGPQQGERVAILSGLSAGDKVVVDGADRLRDGAAIVVPQAGQRPGAGGAPGSRAGGAPAPLASPPPGASPTGQTANPTPTPSPAPPAPTQQ